MASSNFFPKPLITSCKQMSPFIFKEGCVQLDIAVEGKGWLKVEVIEKQSKKLKFWQRIDEFKLSLIASSPTLSSVLLYKQRDDNGRITINQFQSPQKTIIFQRFVSTKEYSVLIPEQCSFLIQVSNLWGTSSLIGKGVIESTVDQSIELSKELKDTFKAVNQSQILKKFEPRYLDKNLRNQEIDAIAKRYSSIFHLDYKQVQQLQSQLQQALNAFNIRQYSEKKFQQKVSQVDLSSVRQQWTEISTIIHEVKK